ncbi:hypothetical protein HID58_006012, partial [Brassica napus]
AGETAVDQEDKMVVPPRKEHEVVESKFNHYDGKSLWGRWKKVSRDCELVIESYIKLLWSTLKRLNEAENVKKELAQEE